jgi:SAM-dependent methyltransferase
VHAVDRDLQALALARHAAEEAGLSNVGFSEGAAEEAGLSNVGFSEGAADRTGLDPESVDVVMLRHVLAHNGGREQGIVNHLASLVRPGGAVYLVDVEMTAFRVYPVEKTAVVTEINECYRQFHAGLGNDLSVGLRLGELLEHAGLEQVDHRGRYEVVQPWAGMRPPPWAAREQMLAAGVTTDSDIERWQAEFERLDRGEMSLTLFVPTFTAFARKPS